jgi:hypothetical protein
MSDVVEPLGGFTTECTEDTEKRAWEFSVVIAAIDPTGKLLFASISIVFLCDLRALRG